MNTPLDVAVLGASGAVGQKLMLLLARHPFLRVREVLASESKYGLSYASGVEWRETEPMDAEHAKLRFCAPSEIRSPIALSALPSTVARLVEPALCARGIHVMSNASNARLDPSVPLLIPEVNADALKLIEQQKSPGKWIKNPNCAAVAVAMGVAPLRRLPAWRQLSITSLQAISGAGFGAVPADLLCANVLPFISGEEEKIEAESRRLLALDPNVSLSVQVFRVPVLHGHTVSLHLRLAAAVTLDDVWNALEEQRQCFPESYVLYTDPKAPQPARHLGAHDQRAHIGQVKLSADGRVVSLLCLIHNLVRGAAGASLKNLEAYLAWKPCASLL